MAVGFQWQQAISGKVWVKKGKHKCNLYFNSVYQLQETRATKALGRLDRRL